jgi:hypothetical protein
MKHHKHHHHLHHSRKAVKSSPVEPKESGFLTKMVDLSHKISKNNKKIDKVTGKIHSVTN